MCRAVINYYTCTCMYTYSLIVEVFQCYMWSVRLHMCVNSYIYHDISYYTYSYTRTIHTHTHTCTCRYWISTIYMYIQLHLQPMYSMISSRPSLQPWRGPSATIQWTPSWSWWWFWSGTQEMLLTQPQRSTCWTRSGLSPLLHSVDVPPSMYCDLVYVLG